MSRPRAIACDSDLPVELWLIDLTGPPPAAQHEWLSDRERVRASRFRKDEDCRRYRTAHCALRVLIQDFTGIDADRLTFVLGSHGKPFLVEASECRFSMSYAGDAALIGLARGTEIGVDIEQPCMIDDVDELGALHFSESERAALAMIEAGRKRERAFVQGWTRKESCIKAAGLGLTLDPASFTSGLDGGGVTLSVPVPDGAILAAVDTLSLGDQFVAAWSRLIR